MSTVSSSADPTVPSPQKLSTLSLVTNWMLLLLSRSHVMDGRGETQHYQAGDFMFSTKLGTERTLSSLHLDLDLSTSPLTLLLWKRYLVTSMAMY